MISFAGIATAGLFMGGLGFSLAVLLAFANKKLHVVEDPRIDEVEELLPKANCGACGEAGCRPFAELVVKNEIEPGKCTVNSAEMTQAVADYLGVDVGDHEKQVARLACAGGSHVAYFRAKYEGLKSCRAAAVAGGGKGCTWGCLGLADCEISCDFGAISMNKYGLPVVDEKLCVACSDCVEACPKDLFSIQPVEHQLWVACKSMGIGDEVEADCEVVCTACGRCSVDAPEGLIDITGNLAVIDYEKNELASKVAIERCPTGAIVWLEKEKGMVKGSSAKKLIRMEPLPRVA